MDSSNRMKEELYSHVVSAGKRKYFFDVKETKAGDKFIVITESRKVFDNDSINYKYEKNKVFLYKEDFEKFQQGLQYALTFIQTGEAPEESGDESEMSEIDNKLDEIKIVGPDDL